MVQNQLQQSRETEAIVIITGCSTHLLFPVMPVCAIFILASFPGRVGWPGNEAIFVHTHRRSRTDVKQQLYALLCMFTVRFQLLAHA